jgi:two-component system nitrogen regulation response regulator GlnG
MPSLLVVDDDRSIIRIFQRCFEGTPIQVLSAGSAAEAFSIVAQSQPDVVVLDIVLPDQSGMSAFEEIHRLAPATPIVCVTGLGTSDTAIESMRLGAMDYLSKPLDMAQIREVVAKAIAISQQLHHPGTLGGSHVPEVATAGSTSTDALIGHSAAMQMVYKSIGRVTGQNINVLIRGESGTGKELVARAIHQHSYRAGKKFLAVNCAAIPESLLESELFGHEKGAFTGAATQHIGKFEECDGGTLFLDEVGDMPLVMQSKVLRAIQEKEFQRVGGNHTIKSDVWIVAATHRDIEAMVASGGFRADLSFRLNGYSITLPPLRERWEDIPVLVTHFLSLFNEELGKSITDVAPETMERMKRYTWPGNIRELQTVIKHAMLHAIGPILLPEFLPTSLGEMGSESPEHHVVVVERHGIAPAMKLPPHRADQRASDDHREPDRRTIEMHTQEFRSFIATQIRDGGQDLYAESIRYLESILLPQVLRHTRGNQSQAAAILGITRGCLRNKVRLHGITISSSVEMSDAISEVSQEVVGVLPQRLNM